jgi:hypothetical protein
VWGAKGSIFHKCSISGVEFIHLVDAIRLRYGVENFGLFVELARRIWMRRNTVIHGGSFTHPDILVQNVLMAVEEYMQAQVITSPHNHDGGDGGSKRWCAPPVSFVKANWDVALDKHKGRIGVGVVVKDSRGDIIVAKSLTKYGFVEPLAGEIMAAYVAVQVCSEMEEQAIIF